MYSGNANNLINGPMGIYPYNPYPVPQPCPSCGHCPTCGRGNTVEPTFRTIWSQNPDTTAAAPTCIPNTVTATTAIASNPYIITTVEQEQRNEEMRQAAHLLNHDAAYPTCPGDENCEHA